MLLVEDPKTLSFVFSQYIPFPRHLSPFPLYRTVSTIQRDRPQSVIQLIQYLFDRASLVSMAKKKAN